MIQTPKPSLSTFMFTLISVVSDCTLHLYADDTTIYSCVAQQANNEVQLPLT